MDEEVFCRFLSDCIRQKSTCGGDHLLGRLVEIICKILGKFYRDEGDAGDHEPSITYPLYPFIPCIPVIKVFLAYFVAWR